MNESSVLQRVAVQCMYEWVTCVAACCSAMHVWMSHVCCSVLQCNACMHESRTTFSSWVNVINKKIEIFLGEIEPYSLETHLHIWISHVPHMNESCPTYECIEIAVCCSAYECIQIFFGEIESYSFESHRHVSSHTCDWVTSHTCGWVTSHTCDWVTSHTWLSHVTNMNESRHTHESCHIYTYDSFMLHI